MVRNITFSVIRKVFHEQKRCLSSASSCKSKAVRVRFAPSPTGLLHLGGFRTALLNYLFAVKHEGKFLLRIEDTDQSRLVPAAMDMIQTDLKWLGIEPHESPSNPGEYGPYIQSKRLGIYHENLTRLIDSGCAYECFCSEKRLDLIRKEALRLRQVPKYDNKCRELTRDDVQRKKASGEKYCVRFKLEPETVVFNDLVYGKVEYDLTGGQYEGDPVIIKSDGYPTYHFANVVDDHFMEISHVLRGVEWQVSTPKHLQMFRAFGWDPPDYAHLPLVMNTDGSKLSKRQGDVSIKHYREQTYYPVALTNFVTKSGGGFYHGVDRLLSLKELAENFNIGEVNRGGCRLDFLLLEQLNQLELERQVREDISSLSNSLMNILASTKGLNIKNYSQSFIEKVLRWCPSRVNKLQDFLSPDLEYLWSQPNPEMLSKLTLNQEVLQKLIRVCDSEIFNDSDELHESDKVLQILQTFSSSCELKHKTLLKDLRMILCGLTKGPPIVELFQLFGKDIVINRLTKALEYTNAQGERRMESTTSVAS